jgi:hypothetical protein
MPEESAENYARFLVYRDLGVKRSVKAAFNKYRQELAGMAAVDPQLPGGTWSKLCVDYHWVERAAAWDVHKIRVIGTRTTVMYVRCLHQIATKAYLAVRRHKPGDDEWDAAVRAVKTLGDRFDQVAGRRVNVADGEDEDDGRVRRDVPVEGAAALPPAAPARPDPHPDDDGVT